MPAIDHYANRVPYHVARDTTVRMQPCSTQYNSIMGGQGTTSATDYVECIDRGSMRPVSW